MKKKICSFVLIIAMLAMFVPSGLVGTTAYAATFDDINQSSVFLNQSESGPCTLYAATMMIRRTAICQGDSNWSDITPSSVKSVGWLSGSGLYYSFNYSHNGVSYAVRHTSLPGGSSNKNKLISLLAEHPEGIEIYDNGTPHAILLTDYTDGIFYCADPSYSNAAARIPISSAYKVTIENADEYWYISSPQSTLTPSHPIANLGDDFYAVILMNSEWKTIGNNNGNVEMVPEVGNAATLWHFVRQSDGSYYIISAKDGKYLDVYGGPCSNGVNVQTFTGNAQDNQKWYISAEKGGYLISPKSSSSRFGYVLDINGGQSNAGTNVQVWEYNGTDAQIFAIYKGSEIYLSASTLSVNPGTSEKATSFSWKDVYGENYYDLKIWNGKYWEGYAYFVALNLDNTSYSKTLPAGYYEGYVDSVNALECKMSNVVCMKIKPVVHVSREGNSYKFSWEKALSVKNYKIEVINTDTSAIAYTGYAGENDTSIICNLAPGNYQIIPESVKFNS